jgi:hypothetical protein
MPLVILVINTFYSVFFADNAAAIAGGLQIGILQNIN